MVVIANRNTIIEEKENPYYRLEKAHFERQKAEYDLDMLQYEQELATWEANRQATFTTTGQDIGEFPVEKPEFNADFNEEMAGFLPFAHGRDYEDISLTYGDSDVDIMADQQELLNDMTELNIEAVLYQLYPEKTLDPKFSTWANDLDPRPGKVYPIPAGAMVYGCGPAPMLYALAKTADKLGLRCEVSMDQHMGCGVGACFACVIKVVDKSSPDGWRYSRSCKEGVVYPAEEVYHG